MASTSNGLVSLRGGPTVPVSLITRMIDMEFRGVRFRIETDGRLHLGPRAAVSADDLEFVRQHKAEMLAAVGYCDRMAEAPL